MSPLQSMSNSHQTNTMLEPLETKKLRMTLLLLRMRLIRVHQLNTITTWRNSTMETFSQSVEFLESLILKSELILSSKLREWPEARLQNVNFILHTGFNFNLLAADFFQSFQIF